MAISNQQENCLYDDWCSNLYPSICQWKETISFTTTTLTTPKTTVLTSNAPLKRVTVCDSYEMNISCPKGNYIQIFNAFYGRTKNGTCGSSWNTYCTYDATQTLRKYFTGYQSILVDFTSDFVGNNPCPGVAKYAIIDYLCLVVNSVEPQMLSCNTWMQSAKFLKTNGDSNYCKCSNGNIVSWDSIDKCQEKITSTFIFYEGFITGGKLFYPGAPMDDQNLITTTVMNTPSLSKQFIDLTDHQNKQLNKI